MQPRFDAQGVLHTNLKWEVGTSAESLKTCFNIAETERIPIYEMPRQFIFLHKKYIKNTDDIFFLLISAVLFHSAVSM